MNKELIKKYKNEFNHWLNNKSLLMANKNTKSWITLTDNTWNIEENFVNDLLIVIKDDFVEFRKALAEGKTIQFNNAGIWKDIKFIVIGPDETPSNYRIKHELPFKAGDWVRDTRPGIKRPIVQLQPNCIALTNYDENGKHYEKWTPEPGEWCWFFNKDRIPTISQFVEFHKDINKYFATYPNKQKSFGAYYAHCEPFVGELPSSLKDL